MIDYANNYQFDKKGNCYNIQTQKRLNLTLVGYTEGYCIKGKFKSLKQIKKHLIKIPKNDSPF